MGWSNWIECEFDSQGEIDKSRLESRLEKAPTSSGVYAIATKTGWSYNTHYVGRSRSNIRRRLRSHLSGNGNKVIAGILSNKKERPSDPTKALYFAYWETKEDKLIEATYISASDRPLGNLIQGARLPDGLREGDIFGSELED